MRDNSLLAHFAGRKTIIFRARALTSACTCRAPRRIGGQVAIALRKHRHIASFSSPAGRWRDALPTCPPLRCGGGALPPQKHVRWGELRIAHFAARMPLRAPSRDVCDAIFCGSPATLTLECQRAKAGRFCAAIWRLGMRLGRMRGTGLLFCVGLSIY